MSEYSMEQVEQVVQILYTDPSKVAQANEWLVGFTNSNAAWEVSVALLRSAQPNVRFFAANALHMKVKSEGDELPRESLGGLLHTLLAAMQSPENAQANILTKLCLAVVALALHLSQEPGKLQKMLLDSPAFLSLEPAPALEFFLLLPQEWERLSLTKRRQDQALAELALQLPRAVALIQTLLGAAPDEAIRAKCLSALAGWCRFGMALKDLRATPLYTFAVEASRSPALGAAACQLLQAAVETETHPGTPAEDVYQLIADVAALRPLVREAMRAREDGYCEAVASLGRTILAAHPPAVAQGEGQALVLCDMMLELTAHPHRASSEAALEFWDELQTLEMDQRHPALRQAVFSRLLEVLATRCACYSAAFTSWDDEAEDDFEDFNMFRRRVEDALLNCCVCLGADALSQLCTVLAAAGAQWQAVEGLLFSVAAIGPELATLSDAAQHGLVRSCVGELLSGYIFAKKLPDHVLVSSTALLVVASYAKCVGQSAPLALHYVVPALAVAPLAEPAARAFRQVCACSGVHLRDGALVEGIVVALVGQMGQMNQGSLEIVVESTGRVLSGLPLEQLLGNLQKLVAPFHDRLKEICTSSTGEFTKASDLVEAASCLNLLGAAVRFLDFQGTLAAGDKHPAVVMVMTLWPTVEEAVKKFGGETTVVEAVCNLFIKAMKQSRQAGAELVAPVVTTVIRLFQMTKCEKCLECVSVAVETFGALPGAADSFAGLLGEVSQVVFQEAGARTPRVVPDLISAYFDMVYRYILFCAERLVSHPTFPTTMQLAVACLNLTEKEPLRAVCIFLERAINLQSPLWENHVQGWVADNGAGIVQAILFALADSAPAEALPRLGPLLFAANARFGAQGREWMRAALASEHFPPGAAHVDAQAREHFLSGNAHLELNSRRYQAMMNDFAQICRRQNTADALLAYQIA